MDNQIKIDETQYLNKTLKAMEKSLKTTAAEIKRTNKHIDTVSQSWGDVRLKTDTYSGIVETAASIRQQQQCCLNVRIQKRGQNIVLQL